ncbi:glutamate receptor ionotropic, delta-2-like [Cylas formicarius]|uniref:glutamate receptor ionotropic, delta-2-like n=1 Tax=Cylas formicarius TaxID=197179 RepID=UPI0029587DBB|nr:glutamate receptor ionotropic, delta-2-like [Cylas formicarius]
MRFTNIIAVACVFTRSFNFVIQPKGPSHAGYALQCIDKINEDAYNFNRAKYIYYERFLMTAIVSDNLSSTAYKVQQGALKMAAKQTRWSLEVIRNARLGFVAHDLCASDRRCKRSPVVDFQSHYTIVVVDSMELFFVKLRNLTELSTFNPRSLFLVYYANVTQNYESIAKSIILAMYGSFILRGLVLIPKNLTDFDIFKLRLRNEKNTCCLSQPDVINVNKCAQGQLKVAKNNLFRDNSALKFELCELGVIAQPFEPFVIDKFSGFEIDMLRVVGRALNIDFLVELTPNATISLGDPNPDGTWTGFVSKLHSSRYLGVGDLTPDVRYLKDFAYSVAYFSEDVVWVAPRARIIPPWRVLAVIFAPEMWAVCLCSIFGFGVLFYASAKLHEEAVPGYSSLERCVGTSFEVLIALAVWKQPNGDMTRVFFIGCAVFGIIVNSVYTSSLIQYLTDPVREHQISTGREIVESDLKFGGPSMYRAIASNDSDDIVVKKFIAEYRTVEEEIDTFAYWLGLVTREKYATITDKTPVHYLLAKGNEMVTDSRGNPTVFVVPRKVMSKTISVMMRRGHNLRKRLNDVIQHLMVEGGVVGKLASKYIHKGAVRRNHGDDDQKPLNAHHLQGAFAILFLGYVAGSVALVAEAVRRRIDGANMTFPFTK